MTENQAIRPYWYQVDYRNTKLKARFKIAWAALTGGVYIAKNEEATPNLDFKV